MARFGIAWARCQTKPLKNQYQAGIRFVDIRCRHFRKSLPIHHDAWFQYTFFNNVLSDTVQFLKENPKEVILMRVKEEYKAKDNGKETFFQAVQKYVNRFPRQFFWSSTNMPTLGQARGKIVILQDFGGGEIGVPYNSLDIEDVYTVIILQHKWNDITAHLNEAKAGSKNQGFLTYASGTGAFTPGTVSNYINKKLRKFFSVSGKFRWGVVAMDYPDDDLITKIINPNF